MNTTFIPKKYFEALQGSPLRSHVERYIEQSTSWAFSQTTIQYHVRLLVRFSQWVEHAEFDLRDYDEATCLAWTKKHLTESELRTGGRRLFLRLLLQLRAAGVTRPATVAQRTSAQKLIENYREFLICERGLVRSSVYHYARHAERFLTERFGTDDVKGSCLSARDVTDFVQRHARVHSRGYALQLVNAMRSFLRYLHYYEHTFVDLSLAVPTVAHWRMSHLPKHLQVGDVKRVLDACDRQTITGRRTYAVLLLLARLGLRAGEIRTLQLEDIDWSAARMTIRSRKGNGWARLPLPVDVGRALAAHLRDRPRCESRNVFVRLTPPFTALSHASVISVMVRKSIEAAGVNAPRKGAHVFRHSLATEMLRQGASLDEIGQVLRHKDADTTAIYAKVDLVALRQLAMAIPGGTR